VRTGRAGADASDQVELTNTFPNRRVEDWGEHEVVHALGEEGDLRLVEERHDRNLLGDDLLHPGQQCQPVGSVGGGDHLRVAWSPEGTTLFHAGSRERRIWGHRVDLVPGALRASDVFVELA
jgi:hypothetical protein